MIRRPNTVTRFWLLSMAVFALLTPVSQQSLAQAAPYTRPSSTDAYNFPVKPGTPAWEALASHDEMLQVTQLPGRTLRSMSTKGLVETVLKYPLYKDMFAFNNVQQGFETVAARFNGLAALLARPDVGSELLSRYQALDPRALDSSWTIEQQGEYDAQLTAIEMLLAQEAVSATLTPSQRSDLLRETIGKSRAKQQHAAVYGQAGQERTALVMGRLLEKTSSDFRQQVQHNKALQSFLREGTFAERGVLTAIVKTADPTATDVEPADYRTSDYNSTVYTPNGSAVAAIAMTTELTSAQISSYNSYVATNYPRATRETNASRKYNCHSYAWHNQSTSNSIWINTPGDDTYWTDGSYTLWHPPYIWFSNMRVSYVYGDHSGIDIDGTRVRSKWGQLPRMAHAWNYSPYDSSVLNYYFR